MKHPSQSSSPEGSFEVSRKRLDLYALAASAAGVSLLALAQAAEGEVVYTPADQKIGFNRPFELDLNNDGIADFQIVNKQGYGLTRKGGFEGMLGVKPAATNRVATSSNYAAALRLGASIGGAARFPTKSEAPMAWGFYIVFDGSSCCGSFGPWRNVQNRYLGMKFTINGETHYGWARFNVKSDNSWFIAATLTGYAYETEANKAIAAGQTTGTTAAEEGEPISESNVRRKAKPANSLAILALGSSIMQPAWRREETRS